MECVIKKDDCKTIEITEKEYDFLVNMLKESRTQKVREEIMNLCNSLGTVNTKTIVRSILKELKD